MLNVSLVQYLYLVLCSLAFSLLFMVVAFLGVSARKIFPLLTVEHYRMPKPNCCSTELFDIMYRCWSEEPDLRPTFPLIKVCMRHTAADLALVVVVIVVEEEVVVVFVVLAAV